MMDECLSSGIPYHDSRGLPKSNVPMGDPPMELPGINDEWRLWDNWNQTVGSQLHIHSLRRVT
eukprot:11480938-Karenia_brevis.AAC.1